MRQALRLTLPICLGLAAAGASGPSAAAGREVLAGPVEAAVERVVDGDTIAVRARIWIDQEIAVMVRLRGIDAPEPRGGCAAERALARRAADFLEAVTGAGPVTLTEISGDKYYGRVLARVTTAEGRDLADGLLGLSLARPYDGGERAPWCGGVGD